MSNIKKIIWIDNKLTITFDAIPHDVTYEFSDVVIDDCSIKIEQPIKETTDNNSIWCTYAFEKDRKPFGKGAIHFEAARVETKE